MPTEWLGLLTGFDEDGWLPHLVLGQQDNLFHGCRGRGRALVQHSCRGAKPTMVVA